MTALIVAAVAPVALALSGCGEAPKLPKSEQSEANKRDGETAGEPPPATSPAPAEESAGAPPPASGGEPTDEKPAKPVLAPPKKSTEAPPSPPASNDAATTAAEDAARRRSEEAARSAAESIEQAKEKSGAQLPTYKNGESPSGGAGRGIGSAQPSPSPAAPASESPVPQPPAAAADKAKAYDVVPVFFGTDRTIEPDPKRLQFGADRGHKLQLGQALITVPDAHKVPNIERPWSLEIPYFRVKVYEETEDPKEHFTIQDISSLTKEQLLVLVKDRLASSKAFKDHAFVFVHGFNTSFDAGLYRTAQIAYDMKFDGAPFVYSWPSGGKVASYTYDRGSAEQAEPHLTGFLKLVIKESGAKSISLIAHSMGNELLLRVLEQMRSAAPKGVVISQVILAAPDVDRDKFDNIARQIASFAKGVTLYAASNDRALNYSARFWGGVPRAGDVPASGPLIVPGIDTIDVTAVSTDGLGLNHSGYAENKTLLNDIALLIQTGERPPDKRIPILKRIDTEAGAFWRYPPAR